MHALPLALAAFLEAAGPIIDVRSPAEFAKGHIPGAVNQPLFDDAERAQIGHAYKQIDPDTAFHLGLRLFGPKMAAYHQSLKQLAQGGPLRIHCWRGGMRSQAIATFMAASGTPSVVLQGGYKSFRRANLERLAQNWDIVLIGGYTGCGKTEILHALRERGEQVLDLENLAQHRGSAYGQRAGCTQPSNEQFENLIAWELQKVDPERPVWVEDESRMIGTCHIPSSFYTQMSEARLFLVERPMVERLHCLRKVYEGLDHAYLHEATCRLRKRLGEERTRQIIELGEAGLFDEAVQQVLQYYDKAYTHSIRRRQQPQSSHYAEGWSANDWADFLLKTLKRTSTAPIPPTCAYKRDKQSGTCAL